MSIGQNLIEFNKYGNLDFVYTEDNKFVIAVVADASSVSAETLFSSDSYPQQKKILKDKLEKYIKQNYQIDTLPEYDEDYEVQNLSENYVVIYYNVEFPSSTKLQKNKDLTDDEIKLFNTVTELSFANISLKGLEENKIYSKNLDNQQIPKKFREWSYLKIKPSSNLIPEAVDKILKLTNKKGTWISKEKPIDLKDFSIQNIPSTYITKQYNIDNFEKNIYNLYDTSVKKEYAISNVYSSVQSAKENIAIFTTRDLDPENPYILVGFPTNMLNLFPTIQITDKQKKEIKTTDVINFQNLEELEAKLDSIESTIEQKENSLHDSGFKLQYYNTDLTLKLLKKFVTSIRDEIETKNIGSNNLRFYFSRVQCDPKDKYYQYCVNSFVDVQTNLKLEAASVGNFLILPDSLNIDKDLSAFLFLKTNEISNLSKQTPKNFFKSLYQKVDFVPYQGRASETLESFKKSTFMTVAQKNAEKAFISDPQNIWNQYKIKSNIEKLNKDGSIKSKIKLSLEEISNIRNLYESILDRYYLKDLVNEVISCYVPLANPVVSFAERKLTEYYKIILAEEADINKINQLAVCIGLDPLPYPITENFIINIPQKQISNIDLFLTTAIKCFDKFGGPQLKEEIKNLNLPVITIDGKEVYNLNFLKTPINEQYDLLVQEAKTYKKAPGVEDVNPVPEIGSEFSMLALRNAWILLQKQIEKQLETVIVNLWKIAIEELLDLVKENCNKKEQKKGDLSFKSVPRISSQDKSAASVDDLLDKLSSMLSPEELCSLLYGTAEEEILSNVLQIIKDNFASLFIGPIVIKGVKYSNGLTSITEIKEFFISISTDFADFENKCKDYFNSIDNQPLPIDYGKCIGSEDEQAEINKLIEVGFTQEQAKQIVDNKNKQNSNNYLDLMTTKNNGLYNAVSKKINKQEVKVADQVKKNINNQIEKMIASYTDIIFNYKKEILNIENLIPNLNQITFQTPSAYGVNGSAIDVKKTGNNEFDVIYKFFNDYGYEYESVNYGQSLFKQDAVVTEELSNIFNSLENSSIDGSTVESKACEDIINNTLYDYGLYLAEQENKNIENFQKQVFEKNIKTKVMSNIDSFINFKE